MKNQIATTREQSQRLIACGVNPDSADMFYTNYHIKPNDKMPIVKTAPLRIRKDLIPAWSLSALLALLPSEIKEDNGYFDDISTYGLLIYPYMQGWQIDYQYCEDDECHCLKCIHDTELIEACVKAIEWLTANGYNLNNL